VGKSTLALALQESLPDPWLRLGIDDFLDFVPDPLRHVKPSADEGFRWFPGDPNSHEITRIVVGEYGQLVIRGMHRAIAAMASVGLNVIVDDVLLYSNWLDDYLEVLAGLEVVFVGMNAPLEVIEQREGARGDRFLGQARGHYDVVHQHATYDLVLDTSQLAVAQCVALVHTLLSEDRPTGLKTLPAASFAPS
jgi:chloramphenicol 3-O phosphotransferase